MFDFFTFYWCGP